VLIIFRFGLQASEFIDREFSSTIIFVETIKSSHLNMLTKLSKLEKLGLFKLGTQIVLEFIWKDP
jgi:hypothetical protein